MHIWNKALEISSQTPPERERYVDFLRALSILMVVIGHWLIAGFEFTGETIESTNLLKTSPGTQWLTWIFQVMPIFFIVGGYANAVSLESATKQGICYADWLTSRLKRLLFPLLALIGGWAIVALAMSAIQVPTDIIQQITKTALIPIWFLAIYIMVVALAPLTHHAFRKYGVNTIFALAAMAILTDAITLNTSFTWIGWTNYFWVWLTVHQLGYVWRSGQFPSAPWLIVISILGWIALSLLVSFGPYPIAMVGSPDPHMSNTLPPKVTLIALAVAQFGLVLSIARPIKAWLANLKVWAVVVMINSMIMTIYLWHITILILLVTCCWLLGGIGINMDPGSEIWWATRIIWVSVLFLILIPVALLLAPIEQQGSNSSRVPGVARLVTGALLSCLGIALLAMYGMGQPALPHLDIASVAMVYIGAWLGGVFSIRRSIGIKNDEHI